MVTPHIALKPKNKKRFIILPCFAYANITLLDPIARPAWTIAGIVHGTELLVETPTSASVSSFLAIDPKFHLLPHGQLCSCCPPHTCVPNKEYCQSIHIGFEKKIFFLPKSAPFFAPNWSLFFSFFKLVLQKRT